MHSDVCARVKSMPLATTLTFLFVYLQPGTCDTDVPTMALLIIILRLSVFSIGCQSLATIRLYVRVAFPYYIIHLTRNGASCHS